MVTAWIDGTEYFEYPFTMLMDLCEAFPFVCKEMSQQYLGQKKAIRHLENTFFYWTAVAGDMNEARANELLNDIATDGKRIDSEKVTQLAKRIQPIVISQGLDLHPLEGLRLIENA